MPQNHTTDHHSPPSDFRPAGLVLPSGPYPTALPIREWGHDLPLQGVTILVVEDSRFACEALRLITRRAGARLRRAETIAAARDHLRVYRPDVVLIDLGLPDGRGEGLIRGIVTSARRPKVVMGISGDPDGRARALAAGADGFVDKPLQTIGQLCRVLRPLLPELDIQPPPITEGILTVPDPLALADDLAFAERTLQDDPSTARRHYVGAFLAGIARYSVDQTLADMAGDLARHEDGLAPLRQAIAARLAQRTDFDRPA